MIETLLTGGSCHLKLGLVFTGFYMSLLIDVVVLINAFQSNSVMPPKPPPTPPKHVNLPQSSPNNPSKRDEVVVLLLGELYVLIRLTE